MVIFSIENLGHTAGRDTKIYKLKSVKNCRMCDYYRHGLSN
jgi:hypothetical protein